MKPNINTESLIPSVTKSNQGTQVPSINNSLDQQSHKVMSVRNSTASVIASLTVQGKRSPAINRIKDLSDALKLEGLVLDERSGTMKDAHIAMKAVKDDIESLKKIFEIKISRIDSLKITTNDLKAPPSVTQLIGDLLDIFEEIRLEPIPEENTRDVCEIENDIKQIERQVILIKNLTNTVLTQITSHLRRIENLINDSLVCNNSEEKVQKKELWRSASLLEQFNLVKPSSEDLVNFHPMNDNNEDTKEKIFCQEKLLLSDLNDMLRNPLIISLEFNEQFTEIVDSILNLICSITNHLDNLFWVKNLSIELLTTNKKTSVIPADLSEEPTIISKKKKNALKSEARISNVSKTVETPVIYKWHNKEDHLNVEALSPLTEPIITKTEKTSLYHKLNSLLARLDTTLINAKNSTYSQAIYSFWNPSKFLETKSKNNEPFINQRDHNHSKNMSMVNQIILVIQEAVRYFSFRNISMELLEKENDYKKQISICNNSAEKQIALNKYSDAFDKIMTKSQSLIIEKFEQHPNFDKLKILPSKSVVADQNKKFEATETNSNLLPSDEDVLNFDSETVNCLCVPSWGWKTHPFIKGRIFDAYVASCGYLRDPD